MVKKFAVIFGSSGAIGKQTAYELAENGWSLYLHFNSNEKTAQNMMKQLVGRFPDQEFSVFKFNFNNDDISDLDNYIYSLDAIVFAQGITEYGLFTDLNDQRQSEIWKVNVSTPLDIVKLYQDKLAKSHHGRIIFIGSVYGKSGSAMETYYSMTKGAISAFANAYAKEVASLGITCNVIAPGAVNTQMLNEFSEDDLNNLKEEIPSGKLADAQDVSYWVKVLMDDRANYLNGQTIYISGGWLV